MAAKRFNQKVAQGEATARKLLVIARQVFRERGYAAATTQEVIHRAGVTKGALYHHYTSKQALFKAVYLDVEDEMAARIQKASRSARSPLKQLEAGCFAYLECCSDDDLYRILRLDGPVALGEKTWQEIDREYGVDRLLPFLRSLKKDGHLNVSSVEAFAYQLTGAMNEATFWIASSSNRAKALRESKSVLRLILSAASVPSSGSR